VPTFHFKFHFKLLGNTRKSSVKFRNKYGVTSERGLQVKTSLQCILLQALYFRTKHHTPLQKQCC